MDYYVKKRFMFETQCHSALCRASLISIFKQVSFLTGACVLPRCGLVSSVLSNEDATMCKGRRKEFMKEGLKDKTDRIDTHPSHCLIKD